MLEVVDSANEISVQVMKDCRENINNLRYTDDTTFMAESKEVKEPLDENENVGLKLNIQKTNHGIQTHHFMSNKWRNHRNSERLYFGGLQNHCRW